MKASLCALFLFYTFGACADESKMESLNSRVNQGEPEAVIISILIDLAQEKEPSPPMVDKLVGVALEGCDDALILILDADVGESQIDDSVKFVAAMKKYADAGNIAAAYYYGMTLAERDGREWDEVLRARLSARYLLSAANKGCMEAQEEVAELYAQGRAFRQDSIEAVAWWIVAKYNGSTDFMPLEYEDDFTVDLKLLAEKRARNLGPENDTPYAGGLQNYILRKYVADVEENMGEEIPTD